MPRSRGGAAVRVRQQVVATRGRQVVAHLRASHTRSPRRLPPDLPELDAVRALLPPVIGAWAEWRASTLGMGADRAIVAAGFLDEEAYLRAYAAATGIAFEPLTEIPRAACPVDDERLLAATMAGILPLQIGNELICVVAPRGLAARQMAQLVAERPELRGRFRMTSAARLRRFVVERAGTALSMRAAESLRVASPSLSAAAFPTPAWPRWPLLAAVAAATSFLAPNAMLRGIDASFTLMFLAWMMLRLFGPFASRRGANQSRRIPDAELPTYTVIAAVYREATSIPGLIASFEQLDWPAEKIDIKLAVEADDSETRAAIARLDLDARFEVLVAPAVGPRTKPKALNAALPFARGTFTVIYDAEDRPESNQLRDALDAFLAGDGTLACVQAALTIDNTADSWLARIFTAEYAAHFDVFLPGLAALRLPLPLGGSSNHFRTEALRAVGAWDPYNVTEDADLGIRLARFGYHSTVIASTTYEEAPARLRPWVKQRTRWFKGWMQTWLVHMRQPMALHGDLGSAGFVMFQLVIGGTVLAALVYPLFLAIVAVRVAAGAPALGFGFAGLHIVAVLGGLLATAVTTAIGLRRRKLASSTWVIVLTPLQWLLLSLAAWRGLLQLIRDPYRWEKTEHGLGKSSRMARRVRSGTQRRTGEMSAGGGEDCH